MEWVSKHDPLMAGMGLQVKLMDMFGMPLERDISFFGGGGIQGEAVNTWYHVSPSMVYQTQLHEWGQGEN